VKPAQQVAPVD